MSGVVGDGVAMRLEEGGGELELELELRRVGGWLHRGQSEKVWAGSGLLDIPAGA